MANGLKAMSQKASVTCYPIIEDYLQLVRPKFPRNKDRICLAADFAHIS